MPDFSIRTATEGDLPAVCEVVADSQAFHHAGRPTIFAPHVPAATLQAQWAPFLASEDATILLANGAGQVVGFAAVTICTERSPLFLPVRFGKIASLGVRDGWRRRGIGRALVAAAEAWTLQHGGREIHLNVWCFNEAANALYEGLGYAPRARYMSKDLAW